MPELKRTVNVAGWVAAAMLMAPFSPHSASAGPVSEFYKLEDQMAEAQEAYVQALESRKAGTNAEATGGAPRLPDRRTDILKKMDVLTVTTLGQPEGVSIALGTFFWSWNLDLDLPHLFGRFERVVKHYADDPALDDMLPTAVDAAEADKKPDAWAAALMRLARASKRKQTKVAAWLALGQLQLRLKKPVEAKTAFEEVLRIRPRDEQIELAKGYLYEVEHLQIGMEAPDFTTRTLDGRTVSLKSLRGKVVLLNFWASW